VINLDMKNNFSKNLKTFRKNKGITQLELSKKTGIARSTLSFYESGSSEPDLYNLIQLSNFFNCSIDELVFAKTLPKNSLVVDDLLSNFDIDKFNNKEIIIKLENDKQYYINSLNKLSLEVGKKLETIDYILSVLKNEGKNDIEFSCDITPMNNCERKKNEDIVIPVVGTIAAGLPILAQSNIEDYLKLPLKKPLFDCRKDKYYALKVKGNSMNKLFKNNEILIIEQTNIVDNNDIAVVLIDNEATVKKVKFDNDLIHLMPESTDPSYTVQEYDTKKDKISIQGKIITTLKEYENNKND